MFQGREISSDRLVAIKAFTVGLTDAQASAFADRLVSLVALDITHPSIVAPIGAGLEGDIPYLVGEYVFGESLDVALRRYGPAPAADAATLLIQVAGALDRASLAGVLHGSLHPRDVLVTPDLVRLTGLGVVASLEHAGVRAPARPPYSAPERGAGGPWESRADVFSLAAVAVELLTGRPVAEQEGSPVLDFGGILVARPEELRQALLRGLARRPRDRYPTAGDLATALELALTGRSSRPAHAERVPRGPAVPRPRDAVRRRRSKPRPGTLVSPETAPQAASAAPLQPVPEGIAEEALAATPVAVGPLEHEDRRIDPPLRPPGTETSPFDPELRRPEAAQGGLGESDVPPIDITPPAGAPDEDGTFGLTAPESGPPVVEPVLIGRPPLEPPPGGSVLAAAVDDLPLEPRLGAEEPLAERPGSLPFEEREAPPLTAEPISGPSGGSVESRDDAEHGRRAFLIPVAIAAAAALILGVYGVYRVGTRSSTPSAESTTASVPSGPPARAQGAPDIYLPAPPGPAATGTSAPAVRQAPATKKVAKVTTAPKATSSSASTARRPAAKASPGSLSVESRPVGVRVFVDGRLSGTTPLVLSKVSAGSHDVRLERAGYRRWSSKIRITSGRRTRLTASLEPESSR